MVAATPSVNAVDVVDSLVSANASGETIIERTTFEPSAEYISQAIEGSMVAKRYIEKDWWRGSRRSVFLVTGLMVVRGAATISAWDSRTTSGVVEGKVDLGGVTGGTVPLSVGASIDRGNGANTKREYTVDGPFILAYRLRRVRVDKKGLVNRNEDFNTLALLDTSRTSSAKLAADEVTLDDILESNDEDNREVDSDDGDW
jgi:hypothetical protein